MKTMFISRKLILIAVGGICVIIGLLAVIYFDTRGDKLFEASMKDYYKTEMYSAAEYFIDDIENGNITLAYHHSKYASDHASQCGMTEAALMFGNMANRVLSGDMGMDMAEQVKNYVESGTVPPDTATGNIAMGRISGQWTALPVSVSKERYTAAKNTAERIFGGNHLIKRGERTKNGELLFTCSNAYALVDERTAMPVEAAISLETGEALMTDEQCKAAADSFLSEFFSSATVDEASGQTLNTFGDESICTVGYTCGGKQVIVEVSRDSGRVVRFISR